jgi:Fe-S-cluster containining protein
MSVQTVSKPKPRVQYDCSKCPGYCCSIYEQVAVSDFDLKRLAKHFDLPVKKAELLHTKTVDGVRMLRRRKDDLLGQTCKFLDPVKRSCTIYMGRPRVCREYPGRPKCTYYDVLNFEKEIQDDDTVLPLFQITFRPR